MAFHFGASQHAQRNWLLAGTTAFFVLLVMSLGLLTDYAHYESQMQDRLAHFGRRLPANPEVMVLALDNASIALDELMQGDRDLERSPVLQMMKESFPWSRAVYAAIIERLAGAGAKVIAFDLMYTPPNPGDPVFKAALDRYADRVVVGANFAETQDDSGEKSPFALPSPTLFPDPDATYDDRIGFVNFRAEDGRVQSALYRTTIIEFFGLPPVEGAPELFSLAARMAQKAGYGDRIPRTHAPILFRYSYETNPFSIYEIFVPRIWESPKYRSGEVFKDKIVLIGPFGNWQKDFINTPFGMRPGPQIHLAALNALLRGEFLTEGTLWQKQALIVLAGLASMALGKWVGNVVLRALLLLAALGAGWGLALLSFNVIGFVPILLSPALALVSSGVTYMGLERLLEYRERMRVRRTLERYVSKDLVKEVLDNPQSYLNTLGGERKRITLLFSDVRGFTTITESADAALLVAQLNEYFTEMVRIVFANLGTLDKFIGDAVMATWGLITSRGDAPDACRAVCAGLEMLRALKKLNASWKERGMIELTIGIGVNHGEAICGHLGSEQKQEITAIGDTVNLASRLEGATKEYHVDILIGEETAALVKETLAVRTVDLLRVKGKTRPVAVFTVLDLPTGAAPPAWLAAYESGVGAYRQRAFAEAERSFAAAGETQPDDWLIQEYLRRTRDYLANPPGEDWDGVHTMTKK